MVRQVRPPQDLCTASPTDASLSPPAIVLHLSVHTGIAHLLEHMAFKGSVRLGTKDYLREAALLNAVDEGAALARPFSLSHTLQLSKAKALI